MTREEAIALGVEVQETQHSMKRRTPWHDYSRKGTYMLTLVVQDRVPLFGTLKGILDATSSIDRPRVELSPLGKLIRDEEIRKIHQFYPQLEVWRLCIMPDHLHMIVRVNEDMGDGKHLGLIVRGFKSGCSKAWWKLMGKTPVVKATGTVTPSASLNALAATVPSAVSSSQAVVPSQAATVPSAFTEGKSLPPLFEPGYNDKILLRPDQLDNWKRYLDDNPRRLMAKRLRPDLFTVLSDMEVAGERCQAVGNRFLLDIPDKMAVIVHRRYTDEENARLREEWLACGERGGVLVSAAIAQKEKEVMREAMDRGYSIILLRENGFPPLYKPVGESFNACADGLLLQISPWEYHMDRKTITREQCLHLNAMAESLAGYSR